MLNKRLSACLACMDECHTLYDIGSDHAYLPIEAIKAGKVTHAYAIDNKQGPIDSAAANINAAALNEKVTAIKASGTEALKHDADCVSIAGLGGKTIHDILLNSDFKNVKRFILQPNAHAQVVRSLTKKRPLAIVKEDIIEERGEIYPIIVMEKGHQTLDDIDLYIGPFLRENPPQFYMDHLEAEHTFLEGLLEKIPSKDARVPLEEKKRLLESVFNEWKRR